MTLVGLIGLQPPISFRRVVVSLEGNRTIFPNESDDCFKSGVGAARSNFAELRNVTNQRET